MKNSGVWAWLTGYASKRAVVLTFSLVGLYALALIGYLSFVLASVCGWSWTLHHVFSGTGCIGPGM